MKTTQGISKQITKLGLLLMMGIGISACSGSEKWKEEVQLSDGRVVVVERETIREGGGDEWAFNRSGSKPKEYRIRFANPDGSGKMIEWRSTKTSPATWPEIALVLDVESGQPIVFSLVAISIGCEVYSKYAYQNGAWDEEALADKFEEKMTNLFLKLGVDMPSFVNLETKRKINSSGDYRRALKQAGPDLKVCG
jgi:hypothetical protein